MEQGKKERYRARHDPSHRPRHAVVTTLAEATGADSTELEASIYGSVELEALDVLLLHEPESNTSVTFDFEGRRITVRLDEDRHTVVVIESVSE